MTDPRWTTKSHLPVREWQWVDVYKRGVRAAVVLSDPEHAPALVARIEGESPSEFVFGQLRQLEDDYDELKAENERLRVNFPKACRLLHNTLTIVDPKHRTFIADAERFIDEMNAALAPPAEEK